MKAPAISDRSQLKVSFIVPAFDEVDCLEGVIKAALYELDSCHPDSEVIIIDDLSTDGTSALCDKLAGEDDRIVVIHNQRQLGCHPSELVGLMKMTGDVAFFIPADGQIMPNQLQRCLDGMTNADYVCTHRTHRADPIGRRVGSAGYNLIVRTLYRLKVHDVDSSILVKRQVVDQIAPQVDARSAFISVELLVRSMLAGYTVSEVEIEHHPRVAGKAKGFNLPDVWATPGNLWRFYRHLRRIKAEAKANTKR